jgi:hypothetical protein
MTYENIKEQSEFEGEPQSALSKQRHKNNILISNFDESAKPKNS